MYETYKYIWRRPLAFEHPRAPLGFTTLTFITLTISNYI